MIAISECTTELHDLHPAITWIRVSIGGECMLNNTAGIHALEVSLLSGRLRRRKKKNQNYRLLAWKLILYINWLWLQTRITNSWIFSIQTHMAQKQNLLCTWRCDSFTWSWHWSWLDWIVQKQKKKKNMIRFFTLIKSFHYQLAYKRHSKDRFQIRSSGGLRCHSYLQKRHGPIKGILVFSFSSTILYN